MTPPREFKLMPVRECPFDNGAPWVDVAQSANRYWNLCIASQPDFDAGLEHAVIMFLDDARHLLGHLIVGRGGEGHVAFDCIPYMPVARELKARFVVALHNHPSGSPKPSPDDEAAVRLLRQQAKAHEVELLDFMIVADGYITSFAGGGYFEVTDAERDLEEAPDYVLSAVEQWRFAKAILKSRKLEDLVFNAADRAGVGHLEFLYDILGKFAQAVIEGEPGIDHGLVFTSSAMGNRSDDLLPLLLRAARAEGRNEGVWARTYRRALENTRKEFEALLAANEPAPAAVAAPGEKISDALVSG